MGNNESQMAAAAAKPKAMKVDEDASEPEPVQAAPAMPSVSAIQQAPSSPPASLCLRSEHSVLHESEAPEPSKSVTPSPVQQDTNSPPMRKEDAMTAAAKQEGRESILPTANQHAPAEQSGSGSRTSTPTAAAASDLTVPAEVTAGTHEPKAQKPPMEKSDPAPQVTSSKPEAGDDETIETRPRGMAIVPTPQRPE